MAESELNVLSSQCIDQRISNLAVVHDEVAAWVADRNKHKSKADWQFNANDARAELKSFYPIFPTRNR